MAISSGPGTGLFSLAELVFLSQDRPWSSTRGYGIRGVLGLRVVSTVFIAWLRLIRTPLRSYSAWPSSIRETMAMTVTLDSAAVTCEIDWLIDPEFAQSIHSF